MIHFINKITFVPIYSKIEKKIIIKIVIKENRKKQNLEKLTPNVIFFFFCEIITIFEWKKCARGGVIVFHFLRKNLSVVRFWGVLSVFWNFIIFFFFVDIAFCSFIVVVGNIGSREGSLSLILLFAKGDLNQRRAIDCAVGIFHFSIYLHFLQKGHPRCFYFLFLTGLIDWFY